MTAVDRMREFSISGDLPVRRLGFGAMRLSGPGVWGPPQRIGALANREAMNAIAAREQVTPAVCSSSARSIRDAEG